LKSNTGRILEAFLIRERSTKKMGRPLANRPFRGIREWKPGNLPLLIFIIGNIGKGFSSLSKKMNHRKKVTEMKLSIYKGAKVESTAWGLAVDS